MRWVERVKDVRGVSEQEKYDKNKLLNSQRINFKEVTLGIQNGVRDFRMQAGLKLWCRDMHRNNDQFSEIRDFK